MPPRHLLIVLLICVVWGGNFLTSAAALRELPPILFTALRMLLLGVLLFPFLKAPAGGHWPRLVAICLCTGALHFALSFWALQLADNLTSPAILMQSYIPMTAVLAVVFLGERFGWRTSLGIGVSFGGVLVLGFDPLVLRAPGALAMMLVSALFLATGTVLMRGLSGVHPLALQAWSAVFGVPVLLAASLAIEGSPWRAIDGASWIAWSGVAYAAIGASLLGHSMFFWLVQRYPVSQITPYLLLTPLVAIALGVLVWGDRPGLRLVIGGTMVLGGVLGIALRARAKARPIEVPGSA
jgi:O-acetylserine/cysteine efflux transporter